MKLFELFQMGVMLSEDRVDFAVSQMSAKVEAALKDDRTATKKDPEAFIRDMAAKISSTHILWLSKIYAAGGFKAEDFPGIKAEVDKFEKVKSRLTKKDLNAYKTLSELYDALEPFEEKDVKSKGEIDREIKKDVEVFIKRPDFLVLIPKTEAASCKYGAGTKWCTSGKEGNRHDYYSEQGPLYTILVKLNGKDRKFQVHYESEQFMDERNDPISKADIAALSKLDGYTEFLNKLIKLHYTKHIEA